jgi:hypothetical protein
MFLYSATLKRQEDRQHEAGEVNLVFLADAQEDKKIINKTISCSRYNPSLGFHLTVSIHIQRMLLFRLALFPVFEWRTADF